MHDTDCDGRDGCVHVFRSSQHIVRPEEGDELCVKVKDLKATFGIPFSDMVYFGVDRMLMRHLAKLGVLCVPTPKGLNLATLQSALERYADSTTSAAGF